MTALGQKQMEVVKELVVQRGATNKEIAISLGISEHTVKVHVKQAIKATGVKNRVGLALWYLDYRNSLA